MFAARKIFLYIGFFLVGLFFFFHLVLNRTGLNTYFVQLAENKIEKVTGERPKIGSLTFDLYTLSLEFKDFSFQLKKNKQKYKIEASNLKTRISFWDFVFGDFRLAYVYVNKVFFSLENLSGTKKKKEVKDFEGIFFDLKKNFIRLLKVEDVSFEYKTQEKSEVIRYTGNIKNLLLKYYRKVVSGDLALKYISYYEGNEKKWSVENSKSNIFLTNDFLVFSELQAQHGKSRIQGSLNINFVKNENNIQKMKIKSRFNGNLDLKGHEDLLGVGNIDGSLDVSGYLRSDYDLEKESFLGSFLNGEVLSKDFKINNFNLFSSRVSYEITEENLKLKKISLIKGKEEVLQASSLINFKNKDPLVFKVALEDSEILDLYSFLGVKNDVYSFSTNSKNLSLEVGLDPFSLKVHGPLELNNFYLLSLKENLKSPFASSCQFDFEMNIDESSLEFGPKTKGLCSLVKFSTQLAKKEKIKVGDLSIVGKIPFDGDFNLDFKSKELDYRFLSTFLPVGLAGVGSVGMNISSDGPNGVSTNIDYLAHGTLIEEIPLKKSSGKLIFKDNSLLIEKASAYEEHGGIYGSGGINFSEETFQFKISSEGVDKKAIASLQKKFFPDNSMSFFLSQLKLNLNGSLNAPLAAEGDISFALGDFFWKQKKVFDSLSGNLKRTKKKTSFSEIKFSLGNYLFDFNGDISSYGSAEPQLELIKTLGFSGSDKIDFSYSLSREVGAVLPVYEWSDDSYGIPFISDKLQELRIRGIASFKGDLTGSFNDYFFKLAGALTHVFYKEERSFPNFKYNLSLNKEKFEADFRQKGRSVVGAIDIDLSKEDQPFNFSLKLDQLNLREFFSEEVYKDPRNFVYLTTSLDGKGFFNEFKLNELDLKLDDFYGEYHSHALDGVKVLNIKTEKSYHYHIKKSLPKSLLKQEPIKFKNKFFSINLSGFESLLQDNLTIKVDGDLDLTILSYLLSDITTAQGHASLDGEINYNSKKGLRYSAKIKNKIINKTGKILPPASVLIYEAKPEIKEIEFDFDITDKFYSVNKLHAKKGDGSLSVFGQYFLDDSKESTHLELELDKASFLLNIPYLKEVNTKIDGKLILEGKERPYFLSGSLSVLEMSSRMSYSFIKEAIKTAQKREIKRSIDLFAKEDFVNIDIEIKSDESIMINSKDLNLTASGLIRMKGTDTDYSFSGVVKTEKGAFKYKHLFTIEKCEVNFEESDDLNPSLHIKAHSIIDNYKVTINILGQAMNPFVEFSILPGRSRLNNKPIGKIQILQLIAQGSLPSSSSSLTDISGKDSLVEGALNYAADFLPLDFLTREYSNIHLGTKFKKTRDGTALSVELLINLMKSLDLKMNMNSATDFDMGLDYQLDSNVSTSVGAQYDHTGSQDRDLSANAKVNFEFSF